LLRPVVNGKDNLNVARIQHLWVKNYKHRFVRQTNVLLVRNGVEKGAHMMYNVDAVVQVGAEGQKHCVAILQNVAEHAPDRGGYSPKLVFHALLAESFGSGGRVSALTTGQGARLCVRARC
jgi:hypothetical protein